MIGEKCNTKHRRIFQCAVSSQDEFPCTEILYKTVARLAVQLKIGVPAGKPRGRAWLSRARAKHTGDAGVLKTCINNECR